MHSSAQRMWRDTFAQGFLAFANGRRAGIVEHSGTNLEDTARRSTDAHIGTDDVAVNPRLTSTAAPAGPTIRLPAASDPWATGTMPARAALRVARTLLSKDAVTRRCPFTPGTATPASGDWRAIRPMLPRFRASRFSINYDRGIADRSRSAGC